MKLSLAIATGRVLITETNPHSFCGCALAMGLLAVGKQPCEAITENVFEDPEGHEASRFWMEAELKEWPWINENRVVPEYLTSTFPTELVSAQIIISDLFFAVERKQITLDQLIDWVRSVEPAEQPLGATTDLGVEAEKALAACAATPDSSVGSIGATDEQLERIRENEYDASANTR